MLGPHTATKPQLGHSLPATTSILVSAATQVFRTPPCFRPLVPQDAANQCPASVWSQSRGVSRSSRTVHGGLQPLQEAQPLTLALASGPCLAVTQRRHCNGFGFNGMMTTGHLFVLIFISIYYLTAAPSEALCEASEGFLESLLTLQAAEWTWLILLLLPPHTCHCRPSQARTGNRPSRCSTRPSVQASPGTCGNS